MSSTAKSKEWESWDHKIYVVAAFAVVKVPFGRPQDAFELGARHGDR